MILDDIAAYTRQRLAELKAAGYYEKIHAEAERFSPRTDFRFKKNLSRPGLSFICEVKRASPSKGMIAEDFPYLAIAKDYEAGGAAAISCLTEPKWFKGDIRYLSDIAAAVETPVLRKNFVVDACQIEEAAVRGASAVLLIAAILSDEEIKNFLALAHRFGLSALCEAHDEEEIRRMAAAGAEIIGVNNRNLKDFTIDLATAERLRPLVPKGALYVAESGMMDETAVARMKDAGADAVLIGEFLMRSQDRRGLLESLIVKNSEFGIVGGGCAADL